MKWMLYFMSKPHKKDILRLRIGDLNSHKTYYFNILDSLSKNTLDPVAPT